MRANTGTLQVYLDDMDTALLAMPIDLGYALDIPDGRAWAGFTGATGRRYQEQHVLSWQFCEGPGGCDKPMDYCQAFGCNPVHPSPSYGQSGSTGRYAPLEQGVPHFSHPAPSSSEAELARPIASSHYADASSALEYADELKGLDGPSKGELDADEQFPYYRTGSWEDAQGQGAQPTPRKAAAGDAGGKRAAAPAVRGD